jgi:uncharacterized repeat protein (TIGR03803 family)
MRRVSLRVYMALLAVAVIFAFQPLALSQRVSTESAPAKTYKVLHSFHAGTDGAAPWAGLIFDSAGALYGTTAGGGGSCFCGTVFKLDKNGKETVLYSFTGGADQGIPLAGLLRDSVGNLYGTTNGIFGTFGSVFQLNKAGNLTTLLAFNGEQEATPFAGVIRDGSGNLYGTTPGGYESAGTVFKLDRAGHETLLHTFINGGTGGGFPYSGVVRDAAGNLYGTLSSGGASVYGAVFKLDKTGSETVLYSFVGGRDGSSPLAGVVRDAAGNFYGTTYYGGGSRCGGSGCGTMFKLDATGKETVLHRFTGGTDGGHPGYGSLVRDAAGNLYGTTYNGGGTGCGGPGCGIVFKLDATGKETVLHRFTGATDGANPYGGLVQDAVGNLYGTTLSGGDLSCSTSDGPGCGVVFKLTPR